MRLRSETTVKCTALILLFLLFGGVWLLFPDVCARLWHIMTCGSMQETIDYIQSFGVWAMLFSFCLDGIL